MRRTARRSRITRSTRRARSTTRDNCGYSTASHVGREPLAPDFDRATSHLQWTPDSAALLSLVEDRGRVGLWRHPVDRRQRRRRSSAGGVLSGFARRRWQRACLRARHGPAPACAVRGARRRQRRARDRDAQSRDARAPFAWRRARVHDRRLERRAGADVRHVPAGLRPEAQVAADAHDPRRPARRAPRRLALPLEQAGVRGAGLCRRRVNYHGSSGFGQKFLETITGR